MPTQQSRTFKLIRNDPIWEGRIVCVISSSCRTIRTRGEEAVVAEWINEHSHSHTEAIGHAVHIEMSQIFSGALMRR